MKQEFIKSIEEAKKLASLINDSSHNLIHVKSVVKSAIEISKKYSEVDSDLIQVGAWWHDVGRLYLDQGHEKLSAEMASNFLQNLDIDLKICKTVYNVIIFHKWIMQPQTIEGEIVRDADKLDYISILRWKSCLKDNNIQALQDITDLLPKLRNEILHLEISKKIYDEKIIKFKKFIKNINKINFLKIKNQILAYNL